MSRLTDAFKALTQGLLGTEDPIPGDTLKDVIAYAAENYTPPADGADGAHITAIELTVDGEGAVTGGTATLSDETTVPITVTTGT